MEYSLFSERMMKATIKYKIRLERMNEDRWVRRIRMWSLTGSRWVDSSKKMVRGCNLQTRAASVRNCEWRMVLESGDGMNWSVKQWINERVEKVGLRKWREGIERKSTLVWYKSKECLK